MQQRRFLLDQHDAAANALEREFPKIATVQPDDACIGIEQTRCQVRNRRLADPAAADFARSARIKRWTRLAALALVIGSPFLIVMYMRHRERVKRAMPADSAARLTSSFAADGRT